MLKSTITKSAPQNLCAVTLLGNLVAKPNIRYRANPVSAVTEITIATNSNWLDKKSNQYKEWTSYHHIKVEGTLVEQTLLQANKGDIILVQGYLSNIKPSNTTAQQDLHPDIIHANFIQTFNKGYTQSINQIYCSARLSCEPKLMRTEQNTHLAQASVTIYQHVFSPEKQAWLSLPVERAIHVWGKTAQYLCDNAKLGDEMAIEGKLNYNNVADKSQFIEVKKLHLFKVNSV